MKINLQNNVDYKFKKSRVSFGAQPWFKVKLKEILPDGRVDFVPALISRLDVNDSADISLIQKLSKVWFEKTKYFSSIASNFSQQDKSYAYFVLSKGNSPLCAENVKSIMSIDNPSRPFSLEALHLRFLQSAPEIADNSISEVRGSGELLLYAAARIAQWYKYSCLNIKSTNNAFYSHLKFRKARVKTLEDVYYLKHKDFESFLGLVEKKYGFERIRTSNPEPKAMTSCLFESLQKLFHSFPSLNF